MMMQGRKVADALDGAVAVLRRRRLDLGKKQDIVAHYAEIALDRFRSLEQAVPRYALHVPEAERWAGALGCSLDDVMLEASGFHDLLSRAFGLRLRTFTGVQGGEGVWLAVCPIPDGPAGPAEEALVWTSLQCMLEGTGIQPSGVHPSTPTEMRAWIEGARAARSQADEDDAGEILQRLEGLAVYADVVLG